MVRKTVDVEVARLSEARVAFRGATSKKQWRGSHVRSMSGTKPTKLGRSYDALSLESAKIDCRCIIFDLVLTQNGTGVVVRYEFSF